MIIKLIDFDISKIDYTNYIYKKKDKEVKEKLKLLTEGFCMYCYDKISHDGHQEHYIDKSIENKFTNYKFNIVYSCSVCNSAKNKNSFRINYRELHDRVKNNCAECEHKNNIKSCYDECYAIYRYKNGIFNPLKDKISNYIELSLSNRKFIIINNEKIENIKKLIELDRSRHIDIFSLNNRIEKIIDAVYNDIIEYNQIPKFEPRKYENLMAKQVIKYFKNLEIQEGIDKVKEEIEHLFLLKYTH